MVRFRRKMSSKNCLNKFIEDVKQGFLNKDMIAAAFIDMSQAYGE